jgi:hypothetical protein
MKKWVQFAPAALQDLRDIWRGLAEYGTLNLADAKMAMLQNKRLYRSCYAKMLLSLVFIA